MAEPEVAAPDVKPTMEETMGAVFDKISTEAPVVEAPAVADVPVITEDKPAVERARAPDGKFTTKDQTAAEAAPKPITDQPKEQQTVAPKAPSGPPASWSAAAKSSWNALPPNLQAEILKRENDVESGFAQKGQQLRQVTEYASSIRQAITPIMGEIQRHGVTEAQAIGHLASVWQFAKRDPVNYLRAAAQELGVDLASLSQAPGQTFVDPEVAALKQKVYSFEQQIAAQQQFQEQATETQIASHLAAFREAKDAGGKPMHPYYDEVRTHMAHLVGTGAVRSVQEAYETATWARPEIRQRILADQRAAETEAAKAEAEKRAAEAARVQRTNVATKGALGASPSRAKSLEEEMASTYDRLHGAA